MEPVQTNSIEDCINYIEERAHVTRTRLKHYRKKRIRRLIKTDEAHLSLLEDTLRYLKELEYKKACHEHH